MAFNDNNKYNLSIAILYFIVLITRLTNCQETYSKTSSTLECYSCSNTSPSKQCSDDNGKSTTSKWSVLKSNPGASTADFRCFSLMSGDKVLRLELESKKRCDDVKFMKRFVGNIVNDAKITV